MSTRALTAIVLSCGIAGLGAIRPDGPIAHTNQENAVPEVPELLGFEVAQFELPQAPGQPFSTTVPIDGHPYSLDLVPHSVRAADFQLLVDRGDGQLEPVEPEAPRTYRGTVRGVDGSRVAASLVGGQLSASIHFDAEDIWFVQPLSELAAPNAPAGVHAVYRDLDVVPPADRWCGTTDDMVPPGDRPAGGGGNDGGGGAAATGLKIIDFAADADVEFWMDNNSNVQTTMFDIELVINNYMEIIYERDLDLTLEVTTIVVRTGSTGDDPYTTSDCGNLLGQVRNTWRTSPELSIRRDAVQLFTGRNLSDCLGISYLATTCDSQWHYSVVESRFSGSLANRAALSAHELGHTFNASHCDGDSDCRIMCSGFGGCTGVITTFGSRAISEITSYANAVGCLSALIDPVGIPFFDEFPSGSLDPAKWSYNDGGFVTSAAIDEPSVPNSLNIDSSGSGTYQDNDVRTNYIDLDGLDDAGVFVFYYTQHIGPSAGETLDVEYWAGFQWNLIDRIVSDGVDQTEFTLSQHDLTDLFPDPFHPEFRLRFRTSGNTAGDDWYIDDVFVGFEPPPSNNDCDSAQPVGTGTFAFTTIGATTDGVTESCDGGAAGPLQNDVWFLYTAEGDGFATFSTCNDADFNTRLAVYDNTTCPPLNDRGCSDDAPGCGQTSELQILVPEGSQYLVRIGSADAAVEGQGNLTITWEPLGGPPCPCDCEDPTDGTVDVGDFLALLGQWGTDGSCDCEDPPDSSVDAGDFLALLAAWGDCP